MHGDGNEDEPQDPMTVARLILNQGFKDGEDSNVVAWNALVEEALSTCASSKVNEDDVNQGVRITPIGLWDDTYKDQKKICIKVGERAFLVDILNKEIQTIGQLENKLSDLLGANVCFETNDVNEDVFRAKGCTLHSTGKNLEQGLMKNASLGQVLLEEKLFSKAFDVICFGDQGANGMPTTKMDLGVTSDHAFLPVSESSDPFVEIAYNAMVNGAKMSSSESKCEGKSESDQENNEENPVSFGGGVPRVEIREKITPGWEFAKTTANSFNTKANELHVSARALSERARPLDQTDLSTLVEPSELQDNRSGWEKIRQDTNPEAVTRAMDKLDSAMKLAPESTQYRLSELSSSLTNVQSAFVREKLGAAMHDGVAVPADKLRKVINGSHGQRGLLPSPYESLPSKDLRKVVEEQVTQIKELRRDYESGNKQRLNRMQVACGRSKEHRTQIKDCSANSTAALREVFARQDDGFAVMNNKNPSVMVEATLSDLDNFEVNNKKMCDTFSAAAKRMTEETCQKTEVATADLLSKEKLETSKYYCARIRGKRATWEIARWLQEYVDANAEADVCAQNVSQLRENREKVSVHSWSILDEIDQATKEIQARNESSSTRMTAYNIAKKILHEELKSLQSIYGDLARDMNIARQDAESVKGDADLDAFAHVEAANDAHKKCVEAQDLLKDLKEKEERNGKGFVNVPNAQANLDKAEATSKTYVEMLHVLNLEQEVLSQSVFRTEVRKTNPFGDCKSETEKNKRFAPRQPIPQEGFGVTDYPLPKGDKQGHSNPYIKKESHAFLRPYPYDDYLKQEGESS